MSSDDSDDGGPGEREVAHRLFAAEFEDASFEYSESDEERAPNYVVTPTGARVNRMFVGGVLTEVEAVNEDTLRGRVVDPTGAFVTYAGQYQPDEVAFLDRTTPPEFVALTGKARTFQPDDSDVVYTSVRPESLNEVDGDTRDRWVVTAAEATLHRVAVMAEALSMPERGDDLREQLLDLGVDSSLAAGVPLALDHYDTTESYLEAVRTMAVQALEVVADERDEVETLTTDPDADDGTTLGALPTDVGLDGEPTGSSDGESEADAETPSVGGADGDTDEAVESEPTTTPAETTGTEATGAGATGSDEAGSATTPTETTGGETATETTAADSTETTAGSPDDDLGSFDADDTTAGTDSTETAGNGTTDTDTSIDTDTSTDSDDDLGSFDDGGLGSFDDESEETDTTAGGTAETPADTDGDTETVADDFDPESVDEDDLDDALTEEEREEVMEQHEVGFSTGSEVPNPEESDLDAPDPEEITGEGVPDDPDAVAASEAGTGESPGGSVGGSPSGGVGDDPTASSTETAGGGADASTGGDTTADDTMADDAAAEPADDVDLTTAVVGIMEELNDGDGVEQEKVLAATVDRHGADPGAVEDAIQDALMNGQCYEAGGGLKPI
jgi:RPA family protein